MGVVLLLLEGYYVVARVLSMVAMVFWVFAMTLPESYGMFCVVLRLLCSCWVVAKVFSIVTRRLLWCFGLSPHSKIVTRVFLCCC